MKIKGEKLALIEEGIRAVIAFYGFDKIKTTFNANKFNPKIERADVALMWSLYHIANLNWRNDDEHPQIKRDGRIVPQSDINIYSDDTHDSHIETVLLKIFKREFDWEV